MPQYRKVPVVIEARQWDGTPESATPIIDWLLSHDATASYHEHLMDGELIAHPDPFLRIDTLEGRMIASVGDYVIKGVKGEFYPCKPDIFDATYEPVHVALDTTAAEGCTCGAYVFGPGAAHGHYCGLAEHA